MIGIGKSHYAPPPLGPFKCANCEYFKGPTFCGHPVVLEDAARGLLSKQNGLAIIEPEGCCNEYEPK
jgi:hypothetical protein